MPMIGDIAYRTRCEHSFVNFFLSKLISFLTLQAHLELQQPQACREQTGGLLGKFKVLTTLCILTSFSAPSSPCPTLVRILALYASCMLR